MKRIISLVLSLIIVLGVCINTPVSLVAYAEDYYGNFCGQLGTIVPVNLTLEREVSKFDLSINNMEMYFMLKSIGNDNDSYCYAIEIYKDAEYAEIAKMFSGKYDANEGNEPLTVVFDADFSQNATYYGKCYSYIEGDSGRDIDSSSVVNFTVNIIENYVVSIDFKPVTTLELIENYDGGWKTDIYYDEKTVEKIDAKYFEYDLYTLVEQEGNVLTVNYKDGTSVDYVYKSTPNEGYAYCDNEGNSINIEYDSDQSYSNQWLPDNEYEFYISCLGVKTFVPVYIKENPIKSVEWVKKPTTTEIAPRMSITLAGGIIRVTGKDGSVQDVTLDLHHEYYQYSYYVDVSGERFYLAVSSGRYDLGISPGEFTAIIDIAGHELTFDYTVTEFDITDITIDLDENKNLYIVLHKSNGTSIRMKYLAGSYGAGDYDEDWVLARGYITTDKGVIPGGVDLYNNGEMSILYYSGNGGIQSNRIHAKDEFNMFNYGDWLSVVIASIYGTTKTFSGKINDNNVYDIVRIALYNEQYNLKTFPFDMSYWHWICPDDPRNTFSYDGDVETAENAIYNTFGIKVDLTNYSIYDKETQKVKIENTVDRKVVKFPITKKCIDGLWYITAESNGETIEIVVDENRNIKSFKIGEGCSHKSTDWFIDDEATVYKAGSKHKECTECGEILKIAIIPQLKCAKPVLKKVYNAKSYVKVTWGTVKGADLYRVYRMVSGGEYEYIGSTKNKYFNDKNAPAGKTCRYKIRAKNEAGYSEYSASIAIKHIDEPKLKTIANTTSGVKITWGKVTGAEKYSVYRKVSGGEYKYIGATSNTYYTDKTAKSGKKYYYAIRGKRDDSVSSQSASLSKYYLADPTLNTPTSTSEGIGLRWSKVAGAEGYMVYRRTASGSYKRITTEKGISNVTFRDTTAKKGTKYYYKVKAYYSKTYSAYSNTKTITDKY